MDDDDDTHSNPSPIAVTLASAPPSSTSLTLALPIQHHKTPTSSSSRDDCWTEAATALLIDAWGHRYLELSRGNLKQHHWKDVALIVSTKTPKTDIQCKNRIDTVKKKYKTERAKIAAGAGPTTWPFYHKLDQLIGPTPKINSSAYQRGLLPVRSSDDGKRPLLDSDDDSEPENSVDSSDGLPPQSYKRPRIHRETIMVNNACGPLRHHKKNDGGNKETSTWGNSMRELTQAILKFGEAYEQAETAKLQQLVEMEKQRMKFAKDLELQRMQYFMKTQLELSQLKNRRPRNTNNHHEIDNNNDVNNNNNSDSSS